MRDSLPLHHPPTVSSQLTDAIAAASEPRPTLQDIYEWIGRRSDEQYDSIQRTAVLSRSVDADGAREIAVGRKAIDLLAKIVERQDEVLFLLKAKPRHQRGRR